jgi:hypothetical protein
VTKSSKSFLILFAAAALAALGALTLLAGAAHASGGVQAHVVDFDWSPASGNLGDGDSAEIDVHFDQPVLVTGDPVIYLGVADDNFADLAHYQGGSGTDTLTFHWTPRANLEGPVSIRGIIDGVDNINASIKDTEGADAEVHLVWDGNIYTQTGLFVDTDPADRTPPSVLTVEVPAAGTYTTGDHLDFVLHFDEPVIAHDTVFGGPAIYLLLPSGFQPATYLSGSGTADLTLRYTVQAGDHSAGGLGIQPYLIGSWVSDLAGNGSEYYFFPSVGDDSGVVIDTTPPPAVTSVDVPANGTYKAGDYLGFTVHFDQPVNVPVSASLELQIGGHTWSPTTTAEPARPPCTSRPVSRTASPTATGSASAASPARSRASPTGAAPT